MNLTDACVCPYPAGDSTVRRMALEARGLGLDSLVAIGVPPGEYHGIRVYSGEFVSGLPAQETIARVKRLNRDGRIAFIPAQDNTFNRAVLGFRGIYVLAGLHAADRHAFDHVTAKAASESGAAIDISLEPVIRQRGAARQKALNRYLDILRLHRKFGFPVLLSTHARSVLSLRPAREMAALAALIGFTPDEAARALGAVDSIIRPQEPVREVP